MPVHAGKDHRLLCQSWPPVPPNQVDGLWKIIILCSSSRLSVVSPHWRRKDLLATVSLMSEDLSSPVAWWGHSQLWNFIWLFISMKNFKSTLSTSLQCSSYAGYRSNFLTAHQCVSVINLTIRLSVCHTQALWKLFLACCHVDVSEKFRSTSES